MEEDNRLGEFIRARRTVADPAHLGFADSGRRRGTGLRREDVATMAGISTDYLARLEQGRERNPSDQVLRSLAEVLDLDPEAVEHLYRLARPRPRRRRVTRVEEDLRRLMDTWTHTPAMIVGPLLDVLAANPLAQALYAPAGPEPNLARFCFLGPSAPEFYADWEAVARKGVAALRIAAGEDPDDPRLTDLIGELTVKSAEFVRLWSRHEVRDKKHEPMRIRHPQVGELDLTYHSFTVNSAPGQQLKIFQAPPGSATEERLALLGSLRAGHEVG
ncbi:helix-turn-helix transcriptional regulator [Amycolatopsis sacchari]|uniref:Helix-turn-helix domain-containing protein n=1 Tax=Amycolatopsis sacchari TaxID=115433 RepID=A0A1I3M2A2_9PSEU|nr:helix-turn-helix transcriptional regulator [Amycolatopsis sacchari]SFI91057.1 Helix-turn-helix domain-containing protein [Amycolatopsis sacchari]